MAHAVQTRGQLKSVCCGRFIATSPLQRRSRPDPLHMMRIFARLCTLHALFFVGCVTQSRAVSLDIPTLPQSYRLRPDKAREEEPYWLGGRTFSAGNESRIGRYLEREPAGYAGIRYLLKYFKRTEKRVSKLMESSNLAMSSAAALKEGLELTCNWPCCEPKFDGARHFVSAKGWGKMSRRCVTELRDDEPGLMGVIQDVDSALQNVAMDISNAVHKNWSVAHAVAHLEHNTTFQKCKVLYTAGFRVDGFWSVGLSISNLPKTLSAADWTRHYISEAVVMREDGSLDGFPQWLRKRTDGKKQPFVLSTTDYSAWGFKPQPSAWGLFPPSKNIAIKAALSQFELLNGQAEDSTTLSNTLVLALPMLLVLVPISLISDVSRTLAIVYAVGTDVWSAVPLAVKGIELLHLAHFKARATRTFVYGMTDPKSLAIVQAWTAECETVSSIHVKGVMFLSISIVGAAFGLALEAIAWNFVRRRIQVAGSGFVLDWRRREGQLWMRQIPYTQCCPYSGRCTCATGSNGTRGSQWQMFSVVSEWDKSVATPREQKIWLHKMWFRRGQEVEASFKDAQTL